MIIHVAAPPSPDGSEGLLAIIVSLPSPEADYPPGLGFLTDPSAPLQVATIHHPKDREVIRHVHLPNPRKVERVMEVIVVRRGKVRVDFYTSAREPVCSHELNPGDVVVQLAGGHGFTFLEESDLVEVKQGPYLGDFLDKERF